MKLTKFALFVMIFLVVIGFVFGATCGDGKCDAVENCNNCEQDCSCVNGQKCIQTKSGYECAYVCDNDGTCETDTGENCMGCEDCACGPNQMCKTDDGTNYYCVTLNCGGFFCRGDCCAQECFDKGSSCWFPACTCVLSTSDIQHIIPPPPPWKDPDALFKCGTCSTCDPNCCSAVAAAHGHAIGKCNDDTPPEGYCNTGNILGYCYYNGEPITPGADQVCYFFDPKVENGESCSKDDCCLSNVCVDGVCCISENPTGANANDKCDADNDGLACGRWSCATGFWECVDDVVIQSFPTGRYTSDDLSFHLPREVKWKKITLYGEIDDGQINVTWKTDKVSSYSNPVSFTTISSSGSTITLDESGKSISIKIDFSTNDLSKTPILKKIIFVSSPRLTNTTQIENTLEGQCWPISISQSTSVEHNPNYIFTTTDCQGPTNASAKIGLTTTEYSENNYSDNKQTIDIGGCFE